MTSGEGHVPSSQDMLRASATSSLTPRLPIGSALEPISPFPRIADYGFLSDCEVTALVAPSGRVEWMCLPRLDGPSIFGALLDRDRGTFRLGPAERNVPSSRRYLPGTMVLETSWNVGEGWIIVRDVLLIGPWRHDDPGTTVYERPPADYAAEHVLLRTVRCVNGDVQLLMDCEPIFDYGRQPASWSHTELGYRQGVATGAPDDPTVTLTTDMRIGFEGPHAIARTLLRVGDTRFCSLSWGDAKPPTTYDDAYGRLEWTAHHWQHWLARGRLPDHPWRSYLSRSALTLKGLTYAPTGAIAAAATPLRETAQLREPAAPLCRRVGPTHRPALRQLPTGLHPPRTHQRGDAPHPNGAAAAAHGVQFGWTAQRGRLIAVGRRCKVRNP